jgi:hypothetical protein
LEKGHGFSKEEYQCDCYDTPGPPDDDCSHPTRKREAFVDELTDGQLKFLFHSENERERMKQEKAEAERNKQQMKNKL